MYDRFDYSLIPADTMADLNRYVNEGVPTGDFLRAVLENNLAMAYERADARNAPYIGHLVGYVFNHVPSSCWGDHKKVAVWIKRRGLKGADDHGTTITRLTAAPDPAVYKRFIAIYRPIDGWNAVEYWWNSDMGFWEPWQTGFGPYYGKGAKAQAIANAISWADAEEKPLVVSWTPDEERNLTAT